MRKAGKCPHCGEQLYDSIQRKRGRPITAMYTLNGVTKHKEDWADDWNISIQLFDYYKNKKKWTIEEIFIKLNRGKKK